MPTLMTVSGLEIRLDPNRTYVMGRALECDIVVADVVSSRRHAMLTVGEKIDAVYVEDLNSRNGTWVNEVRIKRRTRLKDGNSIRIGATVYLVNLLDAAGSDLRPMLETGTEALESLSLGRGIGREIVKVVKREGRVPTDFAGQLGAFSLVEILQLLTQTHRSGTLHLALEDGHAIIEIREGEVQAAEFDNLSGFDALLALAHHKKGLFWLVDTRAPCKKTITQSAGRLLLELCSALDEQGI